ncbi:amino acid adenylation domain-containing protein [Streptomyces sp. WI04-05B]|uniref:non-ribosomal peptide synthetase n=1 Tax=Streptomyces TaxID=1883 RepID=UPI0029B9CE6B|nr:MULTISPECIES: amino acid adenylation domain-containing protein [unclassified Streptomyces]MDX2547625.1 amino acid adenylation domain-containing protein [Streptomyces sp. WI04-05B]MDX2590119.1 amino acid adenylation domain-containing protein [Streptomyces sp. WI04-05A]MDX3752855.1 amino acid adenylation domain-containing protein [Streptomyces sp. AK08-02]
MTTGAGGTWDVGQARDVWTEFNRTRRSYPETGGIVAWIEHAAREHPDRPAVHTEQETLSYQELSRRADRVADLLIASGVPRGGIVAVAAARSVHPFPAILGVLKAGCGYVPVDAGDPESRLRFILEDSGAVAVLAGPAELSALSGSTGSVPVHPIPAGPTSPDGTERSPLPNARPVTGGDPERICYIIYTSGTTGSPKGVRITEANLLNFVHWFLAEHDIVPGDRLAQTAPLTFDPSVQQIFPAWAAGASLAPVPDAELVDPFGLMRWLAAERITIVDAVTAQWHHWREAAEQEPALRSLPDLRWVVVGGETVYHHETHRWHEVIDSPAELRNVYGPTEATINASSVVVDPVVSDGQVSIGVPLPNYRLYVTDADGKLCALGVGGELLIAGDGVADGYQSAEATAKAFGELALPDGRTERVYRTGDLSRLVRTPEGTLVLDFLGRADTQVKIRGFRIELEEVEQAAKTTVGVRDAAVQLRRETADQLVCFYTADPAVDADHVRTHLNARLAAHQVPNLFFRLDRFPVTRNGKLDRAALAAALEDGLLTREPIGDRPRTAVERLIAQTWEEVLGVGGVGLDENFFAIGGTSLLAVSVVRKLRVGGLSVLPTDLFATPTVSGLAGRAGVVSDGIAAS